eukprot:TRINITY_DN1521_c0_g2_i1.p1 TRINITY_DN1521_c0_g2~~TRINITY_DN1521_c0_g2_i1.p1  ORF type:complete len:4962 (-),score=1074.52 TRINITY_DN1521_c0_g2_i1:73-14958(-)
MISVPTSRFSTTTPMFTTKSNPFAQPPHTVEDELDLESESDEEQYQAIGSTVQAHKEDGHFVPADEEANIWRDPINTTDFGGSSVPDAKDRSNQSAGKPNAAPDPKTRVFDFRHGEMPYGATVENGEGELVTLATGATVLQLRAGAYLKLPLGLETDRERARKAKEKAEAKKKKRNKRRGEGSDDEDVEKKKVPTQVGMIMKERITSYSITMDLRLDDRPSRAPGMSLYQAAWPTPHYTDECYISPTLGIGLDGNYGDEEALVVGKWARVVLTVGGDTLTTYVNGKKAAAIPKREITMAHGRFTVDTDGVLLFASTNGAPVDISVKYVKFQLGCVPAARVKQQQFADSLYSQWVKDREAEGQSTQTKFALKTLFRKPHPIWADPAFWGLFCDPFLQRTKLGDSADANGLRVLHLTLQRTVEEQVDWMPTLDELDLDHCLATAKDLQRSVVLFSRFTRLREPARLPHFLKHLHKSIDQLEDHQALLVPSGAKGVVYILERVSSHHYRFVVSRGGKEVAYHPATPTTDSKIKYKGTVVVDKVSEEKVNDDSWWSMLFLLAGKWSDEALYSHLLPWLAGEPTSATVARTFNDPSCQARTPPRSYGLQSFRSMLESVRHLLLWRGTSEGKVKVLTFNLRRQMLKFAVNDLTCLKALTENDRHLLRIACKQIAHTSVKRAKAQLISGVQLQTVKRDIDAIEEVLAKLPVLDDTSVNPPPNLILDTAEDRKVSWFKHPLADRLLRPDDVDGLAGPPRQIGRFVPIPLTGIPLRASTFQEALDALRNCDTMCTMLTEQCNIVKQGYFLKVALIQHTVTQVVPIPRYRGDPLFEECIWAQPAPYMAQLDLLILLRRLTEHFASSSLSLQDTRSLDAIKLVVMGSLMVMADASLRKLATDIPSVISQHLLGWEDEPAYGVGPGAFAGHTDTIQTACPELLVARTGVLDYFSRMAVDVAEENQIFTWERGNSAHQSLDDFVDSICLHLGYNRTSTHTWDYITCTNNRGPLMGKNYPEWPCYRDIAFLFKLFMWYQIDKLPINAYTVLEAQLHWEFDAGTQLYRIVGFGNELRAVARGYRYASKAEPSHFTTPYKVATEDDLLHIKSLPDFDGVLNQRDSELLLSYLTAPYLRVPLVLGFFASADRVHTLRSQQLQDVLDAVLFEPQRHLPLDCSRAPLMVPTEDRHLLGTPYGLLLNELYRSPATLVKFLLALLKQGLECDSGTPYSAELDLILFTVRVAAKAENYMYFLVSHQEHLHPSITAPLRDVELRPDSTALKELKEGLATLQEALRGEVRTMLEDWTRQCVQKFREVARDPKARKSDLDVHVALACKLHAHLVLLFRNLEASEWDVRRAGAVLGSFIYLTNRHTWRNKILHASGTTLLVPEHELWEMMQVQRHNIVRYLETCPPADRDQVLEAVIRTTTDSVAKAPKEKAKDDDAIGEPGAVSGVRHWELLDETKENAGRWGRCDAERTPQQKAQEEEAERERKEKERQEKEQRKKQSLQQAKARAAAEAAGLATNSSVAEKRKAMKDAAAANTGKGKAKKEKRVPRRQKEGGRLDLELNLQILQLTLRASNLQALDSEMANNEDVKAVFQDVTDSMQCAVVESAQNRQWVRLVGRDHDIHWWTTKDDDVAEQLVDRDYDPGELFPSEQWIVPLFEPVRLALFDDPMNPVPIMMPDDPLPDHAVVAYLVAVHPKQGGTWKEIFVFKHFKCVHIYNVHSYGRRFYRSLWFTTDVRFTLRSLTPNTCPRLRNPPPLFRFCAAGKVDGETNGTGCVVIRESTVPENLSGSEEMFIPQRLLFGILPHVLLDKYNFWQDDNDNLRGYAIDPDQRDHYLHVDIDPASQNDHTHVPNTVGCRVRMVPMPGDIKKRVVQEEMLLVQLLYCPEGTALFSLAQLLARLENLSHVLVWTRNTAAREPSDQLTIDLVQLPRLKLTFSCQWDATNHCMALFSLDHANMFVTNRRNDLLVSLCRGIPHSIFLEDSNHELRMLVPGVRCVRPFVYLQPFSTELVLVRSAKEWMENLETPYYLYHVHVSMSFLHAPTLAAGLYLLWLRFANRDYGDAARLVDTIGTDIEFSKEEEQVFRSVGELIDGHPNASAVRCRVAHAVLDSPLVTPWFLPEELANYTASVCHVSAQCQLDADTFQLLSQESELLFKKERVVSYVVTEKFHKQTFAQKMEEEPKTQEKVLAYLQRSISAAVGMKSSQQEARMLLQRVLDDQQVALLDKCLIRNRSNQLEALREGKPTFHVRVPPRGEESFWNVRADPMAITAKPYSWQYLGRGLTPIEYNPVRTVAHRVCLETANTLLTSGNPETMEGKNGFLFLYDLLTGQTKFRLGKTDDAYSYCCLLLPLLHPQRRRPRIMASVLELLLLNPDLVSQLPALKIDQKEKGEEKKQAKKAERGLFDDDDDDDEEDDIQVLIHARMSSGRPPAKKPANKPTELTGAAGGALDKLFSAVQQLLAKAKEQGTLVLPKPRSEYPRPPAPPRHLAVPETPAGTGFAGIIKPPLDAAGHFPQVSNFLCSLRTLEPVAAEQLKWLCEPQLADAMALSEAELREFAGVPLAGGVDLGEFTTRLTRSDVGLSPVNDGMAFDVGGHPDAQSTVAKDMQVRLADDAKLFAGRENGAAKPKLSGLLDPDVERMHADPLGAEAGVDAALQRLTDLARKLNQQREADEQWVTLAIPIVQTVANHVPLPPDCIPLNPADPATDDAVRRYMFYLRRYSEHETVVWLELLIASVLSDRAAEDWKRLNPFVEDDTYNLGMRLITGLLLKANRIGHTNRTLEHCNDLIRMLATLKKAAQSERDGVEDTVNKKPTVAGLVQKADALAQFLLNARHFVDSATLTFDPRFLVFEFTWNIMLRKEQVEMVREFMSTLREGKSLVKQMIMGAGKTTVVSPLLALMLADGQGLVMGVVPSPLLEFTRSTLRKIFSSVMRKRIYTFVFDRSSEPDGGFVRKLQNAVKQGGIVVASSVAVKSVMLRLVEYLDHIDDENAQHRTKQLEKDVLQLSQMVRLFQTGTLIMDEVDLILHPLKSELNFPIGPRHDLDFAPLRWRLPIHLLDAVFAAERGRMSVPFKDSTRALKCLDRIRDVINEGYDLRALQRSPHLVLLDPEFYHSRLKPLLADWAILWLEAQQLTNISLDMARRYLLGGFEDAEALAAVEAMRVATAALDGTPAADGTVQVSTGTEMAEKNIRMLNLAHDWLSSYMPHVLQKIDRVSFGIMTEQDQKRALQDTPSMPLSRIKLAIPFEGKDVPSRASEFAHPDIIIGLSILAYRYEGLRYADFLEVVGSLRSSLEKEIGPYKQRKSNQRYEEWVREAGGSVLTRVLHKDVPLTHEDSLSRSPSVAFADNGNPASADQTDEDGNPLEVVSLRFLKQSNEQQMQKLYKLFRLLPDCLHWYLNDFVFPTHTPHQTVKLSASGQEVGGDMLFGRRLGFSGTPSDLLPRELGRCGYEQGTDGLMMHTLMSPGIVSFTHVEPGWSVRSLLDAIAYADPPFHALIDTGALITGLSNLQVAKYLLQDDRLPGFEGVVFLDELDRKVVLLRSTGRVVLLEECGMGLERRFAFYDQIHTTGMDIQHTPNARAALTLGKDMTFRDYSQGAFRMRGILRGQKIHLFITPEVGELVRRELRAAKYRPITSAGDSLTSEPDQRKEVLREVCAWLVVNSMRSERIQFNQLCIQSVANVWRKVGFRNLLEGCHLFSVTRKQDDVVLDLSLQMFREPVGFTVHCGVPKPQLVTELLDQMQRDHKFFVTTKEDAAIIADISTSLIRAAEDTQRQRLKEKKEKKLLLPGAPHSAAATEAEAAEDEEDDALARDTSERVFNAEIVQEKAQEKEQQREAVIEIEKEEFVDRLYSRDHEEPTRWPFESLKQHTPPPNFYRANACSLHLRRPITFPDYLMVSDNYFDKRWSGDRRMKNVVMVLEWVPSAALLKHREIPATAPPESAKAELLRSIQLLLLETRSGEQSPVTTERLRQLVELCFDVKGFGYAAPKAGSVDETVNVVTGSLYRREQENRFYVALSLAEAETLRRIIHMHAETPLFAGCDVEVALRCLPADFHPMDVTSGFFKPAVSEGSACGAGPELYQKHVAHQSLRFFDCDVQYQDAEVNSLLKALQLTTCQARATYFRQILACRRRIQKQWENAPVSRVLSLQNEFMFLFQRVQSLRIRETLAERKVSLYDAFCLFNASKSGSLSLGELNGAMKWLRLRPAPLDVLDFMAASDQDGDGRLSYNEFWEAVVDPDLKLRLMHDDNEPDTIERSNSSTEPHSGDSSGIPTIQAEGEQELLEHKLMLQRKREEEALREAQRREEEDRQREAEVERLYDAEEARLGRPPNPHLYSADRPKPDQDKEKREKRKRRRELRQWRERMRAGFQTEDAEEGQKQQMAAEEQKPEGTGEKEGEANKPEEQGAAKVESTPAAPVETVPFQGLIYNFGTSRFPKKVVQYGYSEYTKIAKSLTPEEQEAISRKRLVQGAVVQARWKSGSTIYQALITAVNSDGTFALRYSDGDWWGEVPYEYISPPGPPVDPATGLPQEDEDIPRRTVLKVAPQGFLKLLLPPSLGSNAANGSAGRHLNQYTLHMVISQGESAFYGGMVLFKNSHALTVRVRGQLATIDNLGYTAGQNWQSENVDWSYKKNNKWIPFSYQQTETLEKEHKKNPQGSVPMQLDKTTMHCDFGLMKMRDEKSGNTYDLKRMDAEARWRERFASYGFTDEMLKGVPSVDWLTKLESKTNWSDDEADEGKKERKKGVGFGDGYYRDWSTDYEANDQSGEGASGWYGSYGSYGSGGNYASGSAAWWRKGSSKDRSGSAGSNGSGKTDDSASDSDSGYGYWGGGGSSWGMAVGRVTNKKWHHVTVVVSLGEASKIVTYVDGVESRSYRNKELLGDLDGEYSLAPGSSAFLFGGMDVPTDEVRGGGLMWFEILDYAATPTEVAELYEKRGKDEVDRWNLLPRTDGEASGAELFDELEMEEE